MRDMKKWHKYTQQQSFALWKYTNFLRTVATVDYTLLQVLKLSQFP